MGKAGKSRRHATKMRLRRATKAQRRALYASLRGTSKKRKKLRNNSGGFSTDKHRHKVSFCGNVGCARCFPQFAKVSHRELASRAA